MSKRMISGLLLAALIAAPAIAQQGEAPTHTGESGLFTLYDAFGYPAGSWIVGLRYDNWDRLVAPIPGRVLLPGETDNWDYDHNRVALNFAYAVTDRFELALSAPWESLTSSDPHHLGLVNGHEFDGRIDASGIGDLRLGGKLRLWGDAEAGHAVAADAYVELPTGDDKDGLVTGSTGWGAALAWSMTPRWVANLGYHDPGNSKRYEVPEELLAGIGNATPVSDRLDWITELAATFYQGGDSRPDDAFDLTTGGRFRFGDNRWALDFGLRVELSQLSDTAEHCPLGGLLGVSYAPGSLGRRARAVPAAAPPPPAPAPAAAPAEEMPPAAAAPSPETTAPAPETGFPEAAPPPAPSMPPAPVPSTPPAPAPPPEVRETVHFDTGSPRISNIAKAKLDEVALRLQQDPSATVLILGYADSSGSDAENQRLSSARADAARDYLVQRHQISAARITAEGRGATSPVADNATAAGRKANRRAEIIVKIGG